IYFSLDTLALTVLARRGAQGTGGLVRSLKPQLGLFLLAGLVMGGMLLTHCLGVVQAPVAYFIGIKRLSLLISVLYGGLLFREEKFSQRMFGTALMIVGVCFITLGE
ncbi:MAG: EamA/RhaT family transporter, partial [Planctomycetes bacterium]|nr:EamA/RhaT family transporter [Planctomycetota bacterium]